MVASYPISIKVFSTKEDVTDVNYAAHINDLQDEVVALESILGTAPQGGSSTVKARIQAVEDGKANANHTHEHNSLTGLTTGDPHTQYILKSIATTKGDLLVFNGSGFSRVGVGANGAGLVADSTAAAGVKWSTSNAIPDTTFTGKGQIIAGTGASTYAVLGVGTNNRALIANSSVPTGLAWSNSNPFLVGEYTAKGQIPVGTGAGAKTHVPVGANNSMLLGDSAQAAGVRWDNNPMLGGYSERVLTEGAVTGTFTIDASKFNVANLTLTGATTLGFSNVPGGAYSIMLILRQDGTGGRAVTFPTGTKWQNGSPPSFSTGAGAVNIVSLTTVNGGGEWFAFLSGKGMA